eukprot:SAG25_NODE_8436_length_422_cov_1.126935_1_plen_46_part_10
MQIDEHPAYSNITDMSTARYQLERQWRAEALGAALGRPRCHHGEDA